MSKYTLDQLKTALIQADAAGDTQSAQILADQIAAQQADHYVQIQPKQQETFWTDFVHGAGELADNLIHEGVAASPAAAEFAAQSERAGIHPEGATADSLRGNNGLAALTPEPTGVGGTLVSMIPSMALAIPGWEAGVEGIGETAIPKLLEKAPQWAKVPGEWVVKGMGGTLGSDITTGESPDNLLSGGIANAVAETIFHTPKGLRLASALIQKNEQAIMDAAAHIGVTPTAAMASMRQYIPAIEDLASKLPGGHLVKVAHKKVLDGLEAFSQQVKGKLGYTADSTGLGEAIKSGLGAYVNAFKEGAEKAYDDITRKVGKHQFTNTRHFVRKIEELYGVNPRPGIDKMTAPPIARKYFEYIEAAGKIPQDSGYSNLPMSLADARKALKLLDDYIGTGEQADADTAAAKQMASALRKDIGITFDALGVGEQWREVQSRYAEGLALIKQAETVFAGAKGGDDFYRRLFGNPWEGFKPMGADVINALKGVLPKELTDRIAGEVFHRMGLEGTGVANAEGRAFSPANYLTNWNKLSDAGSIDALFGAVEQADAEALAKVSEGIKRAGKAVNHSNTASHAALWQMLSFAVLNPIVGIPKMAALAGGNALLSLALTHPEAARILATSEGDAVRGWLSKKIPELVAISTSHPEIRRAFEDAIGSGAGE